MSRIGQYTFFLWALTIFLFGPILFLILIRLNLDIGYSSWGEASEYLPIIIIFSLLFSIPSLLTLLIIAVFLNKWAVNPIYKKVTVSALTLVCIQITFYSIDEYFLNEMAIAYSLAVILASLVLIMLSKFIYGKNITN